MTSEAPPCPASARPLLELADAFLGIRARGVALRAEGASQGRIDACFRQLGLDRVQSELAGRIGQDRAVTRAGFALVAGPGPMVSAYPIAHDLDELAALEADRLWASEVLTICGSYCRGEADRVSAVDRLFLAGAVCLACRGGTELSTALRALPPLAGRSEPRDLDEFAALARELVARLAREDDAAIGTAEVAGAIHPRLPRSLDPGRRHESSGPIGPEYDPLHEQDSPAEDAEGID